MIHTFLQPPPVDALAIPSLLSANARQRLDESSLYYDLILRIVNI